MKAGDKCVVLDMAHSYNGESVILDFPPGITPYLGMELNDINLNKWEISGMGLPVILSMLDKKMDTFFDSDRVWDCLLRPVNHKVDLEKGNSLSIMR